jgi:hypothetical protein
VDSNKVTIRWRKGSHELEAFGRVIPCLCDVRNEINGRRHDYQVVYSIPDDKPYQPRVFPVGVWQVAPPKEKTDPYMAPWFIPTNAMQKLPVWELKDKKYFKPTEQIIRDWGYGLHYSTSGTTLGCIKIINLEDLEWLVQEIHIAFLEKKDIFLEVYV